MSDEWDNGENGRRAQPAQEKTRIASIGKTRFKISGNEVTEFESARRYIMASQIAAVVSLFIGGVVLSGIALICAIVAYGKLGRMALGRDGEPEVQRALRRSGIIVIAVSASALAVNAIAMVILYPMLVSELQAGTFGSLATSAPSTGVSASGTWG